VLPDIDPSLQPDFSGRIPGVSSIRCIVLPPLIVGDHVYSTATPLHAVPIQVNRSVGRWAMPRWHRFLKPCSGRHDRYGSRDQGSGRPRIRWAERRAGPTSDHETIGMFRMCRWEKCPERNRGVGATRFWRP